MPELRYPYRAKIWKLLLAAVFFGACALIIAHKAQSNDKDMIINHLIELDTHDATIFLWILAALSAAFVLTGIVGIAKTIGSTTELVLAPDAITAPKSGLRSKTLVTVPYRSITNLVLQKVQSQKFLIIHHPGGKLGIVASMLPGTADFETVCEEIAARWDAARGKHSSLQDYAL